MSERRNENERDAREARLEALYREAGDVEPDAGLDRIVRARADQAARSRRSSNRLPWLGGLATASVALVAIAVVLQQTPPADRNPGIPGTAESEAPAALMAPSVGADATLESSSEARRARSGIREMQSQAGEKPEAAAPPSSAVLGERAQSMSEQQRAERLADIVAKQAAGIAEPERAFSEEMTEAPENAEDPEAMLARIESLIEADALQDARDLLDAFRRQYPEHPIPEKIRKTLAPPE